MQDMQRTDSLGAVPNTRNGSLTKKRYVEKQSLTLPLLSMAHLDTLFCKVLGEPYKADFELKSGNSEPPTVVRVLDLDNETQGLLICSAIIKSAFDRAGSPLTGRCFKLVSGGMKDGNQFSYRQVTISEFEEINEE